MNVSVSIIGMGKLKARLSKLKGDLRNPRVPMMQAAVQVTEETFRNFVDGGRPEAWAPLTMLTLFIKAHRADGPKRTGTDVPLSDSGRLKGSFIPFVGDDSSTFGTLTNVEYAGLMQNGGTTEAQDIQIKGFTRRLRESQFESFATGKLRRIKKDSGGTRQSSGKVRDYVLHLAGGADIPARQFFPNTLAELSDWGYQAKIKGIFWNYFHQEFA